MQFAAEDSSSVTLSQLPAPLVSQTRKLMFCQQVERREASGKEAVKLFSPRAKQEPDRASVVLGGGRGR